MSENEDRLKDAISSFKKMREDDSAKSKSASEQILAKRKRGGEIVQSVILPALKECAAVLSGQGIKAEVKQDDQNMASRSIRLEVGILGDLHIWASPDYNCDTVGWFAMSRQKAEFAPNESKRWKIEEVTKEGLKSEILSYLTKAFEHMHG